MLVHTLSPSVTTKAFSGMLTTDSDIFPSLLHSFYRLWWTYATSRVMTTTWPAMMVRHVPISKMFQYVKNMHPGIHETRYTQLSHRTVIYLFTCLFPLPNCKLFKAGEFFWSPFTGHLFLITKSLAHSSTCKCLNAHWQVAALWKPGASGFQSAQGEGKRQERMETMAVYSQVRPWNAIRITLSTPSFSRVKGDHLRIFRSIPAAQKVKPLHTARTELSPQTPRLTHTSTITSGNHCYTPKGWATDECWAQRRWFWFILLLPLHRRVRPYFKQTYFYF